MTDEIETKLLKEIERIENKPRVAGELTHSSTIPTLKERLSQHRQTKTWIEGLIYEHRNCSEYHKINGEIATCLDIVLKKISGEGK